MDTVSGGPPASVPAFVLAQLIGAALGTGVAVALHPDQAATAAAVVVPPDTPCSDGTRA